MGRIVLSRGPPPSPGARFATRLGRREDLAIVVMDCQELGWVYLQGKSEAIVSVDYCLDWKSHNHQ